MGLNTLMAAGVSAAMIAMTVTLFSSEPAAGSAAQKSEPGVKFHHQEIQHVQEHPRTN